MGAPSEHTNVKCHYWMWPVCHQVSLLWLWPMCHQCVFIVGVAGVPPSVVICGCGRYATDVSFLCMRPVSHPGKMSILYV